ncbi:hypothetical protein Pcinc_003856 [Petrolisthes cinctipes]|uniref:Uncharacterized protein n=1 Tax=Petrolisthes cinctipes TaxID=88211 RepID=A0AAE1GHZ8_PETCI|nr:hypothetical protein Pcinc_003856 [Petrolisthes cinctipes]
MPSLGHESHRHTYIQPKTSTKQIRSLELTFSESEEEDIDEDRSQKEDSDWRQTPLFKKISKITSEQHKGEKAMMDLEISRHSTTTTNTQAVLPTDAVKMEDGNTSNEGSPEKETKEFGTEFTFRQAKLNEELQVDLEFVKPRWVQC